MTKEELLNRTKQFAYRYVNLAVSLPNTALGNHVRVQLIRCSTSVAANYRAVCIAQSKNSFISKLSIVIEECDESTFWLEFIVDMKLKKEELVTSLTQESRELTAIFMKSRKTARNINSQSSIENSK